MTPPPLPEDERLERVEAELEAEQNEIERTALERGDDGLPPPPADEEEPALPEEPSPIEPDMPPQDEGGLGHVAGDQDGDPAELSDDEVTLLFGPEELDPFAPEIEQDPDYDPLSSKPAVFR